MSRIIVAIDSLKGCLSSAEANQAAAEGIRAGMPDADVIQIPVSDGGEGWLDAFRHAVGGVLQDVNVFDPLMRPIVAQYLMTGETAVIEMAKASGLTLLAVGERNPLVASSYGTGQLVVDAVRKGCRHVVVGLGGSATSDCGIFMLEAICDGFSKDSMSSWKDIHELDDVSFTIATDVTNPLRGENGAAHVFAPQKGATPEAVEKLEERAIRFSEASAHVFGFDRQNEPGAGAAGGLGYAFMQYLNAGRRSGIDLLLETIRFDELLKDASLVITGEGSADRQTLMGKLPFGILRRAGRVPVILIAGRINDHRQLLDAGFSRVECISPPHLSLEEAMKPETAKGNIASLMKRITEQL